MLGAERTEKLKDLSGKWFCYLLSPHLPASQKYPNKNAHPVKKENIKPSAPGCEPSVQSCCTQSPPWVRKAQGEPSTAKSSSSKLFVPIRAFSPITANKWQLVKMQNALPYLNQLS